MRRRSLAALAALSLAAAAPAAVPVTGSLAPASAIAKSCSSGYKHAVINRAHKCLRRGQYCAKRYDGYYHRYGFHCHTGRLR